MARAKIGRPSVPVEDRFWKAVVKSEGCWDFAPHRRGNGYRSFRVEGGRDGMSLGAHVYSFLLHYGPFHRSLQINHHCDNKKCVRPDHLYAGTVKQNADDMMTRGRHVNNNPHKEFCVHGHEMTEANIYRSPSRPHIHNCRECLTIRNAARYMKENK